MFGLNHGLGAMVIGRKRRDNLKLTKKQKEYEEKMVEENINFVHYIIHKHFNNIKYIDYDELFQIGSIALLKAVRNFKPNKGYKFNTFAAYHIKHSIYNLIRDRNNSKNKFDNNAKSIEENIVSLDKNPKFKVYEDYDDIYYKTILFNIIKNVTTLSNLEKYIIIQNYYGNSNKAISKKLNKTNKNIANKLYDARKKIKKYLQENPNILKDVI